MGVSLGKVIGLINTNGTEIAQDIASQVAVANVEKVELKSTDAQGNNTYEWTMKSGATQWTWNMIANAGKDSYLGEYRTLTELITKYPTAPITRFAILYDKIDADHPKASGIVSLAQYDTTKSQWVTIKLNESISASTDGSAIGFSGGTTARLALLDNVNWNTKEFLYLDTDLHCLMLYKPSVLQFIHYDGGLINVNPPSTTPSEGQVWVSQDRVYVWDNTKKYWKVSLHEYIRKYTLSDGQEVTEALNGADIKFIRSGSQYMVSVYQRVNADKIHYAVNDVQASALLDTNQSHVLIDNIADGITYDISVTLKFNGVQNQYKIVKYDDTIFIITNTAIVAPSSAYMTMSTLERSLFKKNAYTSTKIIYDVDLDCMILWDGTAYVSFSGQPEKGTFPAIGTEGQVVTGTTGVKYTYSSAIDLWYSNFNATKDNAGLLSASDKDKLDKLVATPKDNLTATAPPSVTDDTKAGYSAGSTWVYDGTTYTCTDATEGKAKWVSSADIFYTDTWASLIALISVSGTTYVGKYFTVTNANGGASSGVTYTAPNPVTNPIVDGGSATYLINTQGSAYSVTCLKRVVTNPIIASVMLTATTKPTSAGYHIFTVIPTDGLPSGCSINDICYYDGATWSKFQTYATAPSVIIVGSSIYNQTSWRKFQGTWMNTADEYVPDKVEYLTGKLWNGKPVYRGCTNITLPACQDSKATGLSKPKIGTLLVCTGTATRTLNNIDQRFPIGQTGTGVEVYENMADGTIWVYTSNLSSGAAFSGKPAIIWVEYTKN